MSITRRGFLKGMAAGSAAVLIGPGLLSRKVSAAVTEQGTWKTSGSHWGAINALVKGGTVAEVRPFGIDEHFTEMIKGIRGLIYNPSRIRYPMVRLEWLKNRHNGDRTTRGDNRFVRVTWDEALDLFYNELERVQTEHGPSGLYAGATGWRQTGQVHSCGNHMQRAIAMHGDSVSKVGDYSTGAGQFILPYILGSTEVYSQGTSWPLILENSKTVILWGNDLHKNLQVGWNCETHEAYEYLEQLKAKVADGSIRVISVDPVRSKTQNYLGCEQLYVNPMTDVPFMLGIAHTLYTENLYDKKFIETYALGFKDFIDYVMGETDDRVEKAPASASAKCGIDEDKMREFARLLASDRTQLLFGWAVQRQQHGEQPYWIGAVIATMLGQIGLPCGGISYAHHYSSIGVSPSGASAPGAFLRNIDAGKEPKHPSTDYT